ncbi:MAG: hypothetical protein EXR99_08455 [Gemmataceae bacterium]|nr:hypothetical protein [Gemmataceae bacterium]
MSGKLFKCLMCDKQFPVRDSGKINPKCPKCNRFMVVESPVEEVSSPGFLSKKTALIGGGVLALVVAVVGLSLLFLSKPKLKQDIPQVVENETPLPDPGGANTTVPQAADLTELRTKLGKGNSTEKIQALNRLAEMGPEALPLLGDIASQFTHADEEVKLASLRAFASLGPVGKPELPKLIVPLADSNVKVSAAAREAFIRTGPFEEKDLPVCTLLFNQPHAGTKSLACQTVSLIKPPGNQALSLILGAMHDKAGEVREAAVKSCQPFLGKFHSRVFQEVFLFANDAEAPVRQAVEKLLMAMLPLAPGELGKFEPFIGSKTQPRLRLLGLRLYAAMDVRLTGKEKSLLEGLTVEDHEIQLQSLSALTRLHPEPLPAMVLGALALGGKKDFEELHKLVLQVVEKGKIATAEELQVLAAYLQEKTPVEVKSLALKVLANSPGLNWQQVLPELVKILKAKDATLASLLLLALAQQSSNLGDLTGPIGEWARSPDQEMQTRAFNALRACGLNPEVLALLRTGLLASDPKINHAALSSLLALNPEAKEPYPLLLEFCKSKASLTGENFKVRLTALREARLRYAKIEVKLNSDKLNEAVVVFADFLGCDEARVAQEVLEFLGDMGPEALPAFPKIVRVFQKDKEDLVETAATAIARMGKSAIPPLIKIIDINLENYAMKVGAVQALGKMGPLAKEAAPYLFQVKARYQPKNIKLGPNNPGYATEVERYAKLSNLAQKAYEVVSASPPMK